MIKNILLVFAFFFSFIGLGQPITNYRHFSGKYDFTMLGNTLNSAPNGSGTPCTVLTQSSALLNLLPGQTVVAAYLYWSGSGSLKEADLNVKLNGNAITAQRTFTATMSGGGLPFFGAFADVTTLVKNTGNGTYLLSDLDINSIIAPYCPTGINYAGWSIIIIYEDLNLTNRVVSLYDGFEILDPSNQNISITLNGLNVTAVGGAKVGFLVWEGDANIAVGEELRINNKLVSNPPLNPVNNTFNCTNSFTGASNLWNMDIDYYSISNYISLGDTSMTFQIRSIQDLIIANSFVVTLSSVFADATIKIDEVSKECNSREVKVNYTVSNFKATNNLITNTPIAFYADGVLVGSTATKSMIPIDESRSGTMVLKIPDTVADDFVLTAKVDDDGTGIGIVIELDETNNSDSFAVELIRSPEISKPADLSDCDVNNEGFIRFDLTVYEPLVTSDSNAVITYFESEKDAIDKIAVIKNPTDYEVKSYSVKNIWIRVEDKSTGCYAVTTFKVVSKKKVLSDLEYPLMICNSKDNPAIVNLSLIEWLLSKKVSYLNEIELRYFLTKENAENESNEITNVSSFEPTYFPSIIYVKAKARTALWCDNIIEVQLNDCMVPKGISPNGDGLNDGFDLTLFNLLDLQIFNRYGMEVYRHGEGYINQWKGQDKSGKELPAGTYYYIFKTLFDTYLGYVYVIREVR